MRKRNISFFHKCANRHSVCSTFRTHTAALYATVAPMFAGAVHAVAYRAYAIHPYNYCKTKHRENYIGCRKNYIGRRKNYV